MEWFTTFKEKQKAQRNADIKKQAEDMITLTDLNGSIYIAYNGTSLVPVDPSWTTKEIVQQLSILRQNYITSKQKEHGILPV